MSVHTRSTMTKRGVHVQLKKRKIPSSSVRVVRVPSHLSSSSLRITISNTPTSRTSASSRNISSPVTRRNNKTAYPRFTKRVVRQPGASAKRNSSRSAKHNASSSRSQLGQPQFADQQLVRPATPILGRGEQYEYVQHLFSTQTPSTSSFDSEISQYFAELNTFGTNETGAGTMRRWSPESANVSLDSLIEDFQLETFGTFVF